MSVLVAYVDGGSLGNPGPSGIGVVIDRPEGASIKISKWIGHQDNNVAEYVALLEALQCALNLEAKVLHVYSDSEVMVRQMRGQYGRPPTELLNFRSLSGTAPTLLHPFPSAGNNVGKSAGGFPSEHLLGTRGIRNQNRRIARPPRPDFPVNGASGGGFRCLDDLENRISLACSQIKSNRLAAFLQMLKSADVRVGQVIDMDVVAHAGAVWSGVVRAEDLQFGSVASGGERKRNQVGLGIMQLADFTALICASGVEVAQTGRAQAVSSIVGFERILTEKFGSTIWIDRLARVVLRDRNLGRLAINGARRRKHKTADNSN